MKTKKTVLLTILALTGMFLLPLNSRGQTFQTPPTQISPQLALSSGVTSHFADIDNDGDLDIVHSYHNHLSWYENTNGAGAYVLNQNIGPSPYYARAVFAADLDNDGDLDLLTVSSGASIIYWHENLNGAGNYGPAQTILTAEYGTNRVLAEDIDGDGFLDLLTAAFLSDRVAWYRNDGTGSFGAQQIINTGSEFMDIDTADVDGDGIVDVISASRDDNRILWYKNDGLGNFTIQPDITDTAMGAAIVFFADMDGDGDQDALSGSFTDDRILWYDNTDGLGSFGPPQDIPLSPGFDLREIFPADFDLDGDMDVVSASHGSSNSLIAWHENLDCASGIFQQETIDDSVWIWGVIDVKAGDIDLDGDFDVLSLESAGTELKWYENITPEPPLENLPDFSTACDGTFETLCGPYLVPCENPSYSWYSNDGAGSSVLVGHDQCFTPTQAGSYTLVVTDENGYFFNHTVTVIEEVPVPQIGMAGEACVGDLISVSGQGYDNPNYLITWLHNGNPVQVGGETLLTSFTSGTITVQIEVAGCDPVSATIELVYCCPEEMFLEIDCVNQTVFIENFPTNIAGAGVSSWSHNGTHIPGQPIFATSWNLDLGEGLYEVTVLFEFPDGTQCEFTDSIEYLESNCCDETGPVANASFVNVESYSTEETYYGPMEIPVLCDFTLDASASFCEEKYALSIAELDLATWNTNTVLPWTSFSGQAGNAIDLAQLMQPASFVPGQAYLLSFNVGPGGTTEYIPFYYGLSASATILNSSSTITLDTPYGEMEVPVINCGLRLDGSASTCEDSYFISIQAYDPLTWTATAPPIYEQWFSGQAPPYIDFPGVFPNPNSGEFYILTFAVGPTWTPTYIPLWYQCSAREASVKSTDKAGQSAQILLAPNPTNDIVKLYTKFNSGQYQLYDITGKLIMASDISVYENSIDLSNYSSGVYILKIQDEDGAWHHKRIIKQ